MSTLRIGPSGNVQLIDDDGRPVPLAELEQRLRRAAGAARSAGADPRDVQAVLILAGVVKTQARLLQRIEVMEPLARSRAQAGAALDIVNLTRGLPRPKQAQIRRLAAELQPRFKSARSLYAAVARQSDVTPAQARQVLNPPKRDKR